MSMRDLNARIEVLHTKLEALERRAESPYLGREDAFNLSALIYDIDRFLESSQEATYEKNS
jgi:hypothetical protein